MVEDQKRTHEEQLQLLQEKVEREKEALREETERMVQHKLKEQEQLLKEGFAQKASEMQNEIQRLQAEGRPSDLSVAMSALENIPSVLSLLGQGIQCYAFSRVAGASTGPNQPSKSKAPKSSKK
ncbi:PREDICTED: guanylate-binding protein 4-like [Gekko japonicus]|uniref:Guanylate-binding protein 4-like n=1 Tax=Gekko japonicus TaxID=146911 RepID=A0ABM1KJD3_GEKJA|nr:PREDICTED: guanylate-binding protein 4-like [Gekko japonicus]